MGSFSHRNASRILCAQSEVVISDSNIVYVRYVPLRTLRQFGSGVVYRHRTSQQRVQQNCCSTTTTTTTTTTMRNLAIATRIIQRQGVSRSFVSTTTRICAPPESNDVELKRKYNITREDAPVSMLFSNPSSCTVLHND